MIINAAGGLSTLLNAAKGMSAQKDRINVSANNVANFSSVAYKAKSAQLANGGPGLGVHIAGVRTTTSQGPLMKTDSPTDIAISGAGFFLVENEDGEAFFTRAGNFTKDKDGFLRTASGEFLMGDAGRIQIPADTASFSVGGDGVVTVVDQDGNAVNAGRINLALFENEQALASEGGGLYSAPAAAGAPQLTRPGQNGAGTLAGGALEISNVDYISEAVATMLASRSFQANAKAFQTADEILQTLI